MDIKRIMKAALLAASVIMVGANVYALKAPHSSPTITSCSQCHKKTGSGFKSITGFTTLCFNADGCHNPDGGPLGTTAKKKQLSTKDASRRFGSVPPDSTAKNSSHAWKVNSINQDAGVTAAPTWGDPGLSGSIAAVLGSKITCTRCHRAHGEKLGKIIYAKFLRENPKGDNICLQCHTARRAGAGAARSAPVTGKDFTHPVEVNYSSVRSGKSDFYEASPTLTAGYNESARPRLYTTIGNVKGAVVCSSCHGPIHAADSNPYTFDSLSSYSRTGNYSTSAGNLLRQYPMTKAGHENNLCKSCHKVETHMTYAKCSDCHEIHRRSSQTGNDKNIYLIRTSIMTSWGKKSVQFQSTTQMANRFGIYSYDTPSNPFGKRSSAICQVCHKSKMYHRAYSTAGARNDHSYNSGTGKYGNCVGCHPHSNASAGGAFKLGGEAACGACHESPPSDAADGKHFKHIGAEGGSNYNWLNGAMLDERAAERYGFSCGRCHSPWAPYTSSQNWPRHRTTSTYDDNTIKGYTTEYGFKIRTAFYPLNTKADYVRAASGVSDPGKVAGGSRFSWSNGTCRNLYCHGQFFGGYTSANPTWNGTLPTTCSAGGSCHGTTSSKLPGVNGVGEWGAHRRHLGNAAGQYGAAGTFWCNACHSTTASLNNATTLNRIYHVNGKTNVKFAAAYQTAASRYGVLNDYSGKTNISETVKTQYQTCGLVYCHSDGSRMSNFSAPFDIGNKNFPNWSSTKNYTTTVSGVKRRCVRCHGNSTYKGITASMPGYSTRPGKGNAHDAHIKNRILCYACHTQTVAADNRTLTVSNHVDKIYNVNMAASFGGTWDNGTKRCSNVKCHSQRLTPAWDTAARCQDCHYSSSLGNYTGERKGYNDSYRFRNWTVQNSTPRIYSTEWAAKGHGKTSARLCNDCHSASVSHAAADSGNNPYRLTNADVNALCKQSGCHPTYKSHTKADMDNYGNSVWAFDPKCVDCHDPHSDSNRGMIKKFINFTTGSNPQGRVLGANLVRQVTFTTVGGGLINWSSFVKGDFSGICQRCHNTQTAVDSFRKNLYSPDHFPRTKCTDCHQHTSGFKPKGCKECHFAPPRDENVAQKMKHDRHVNWTSPTVDLNYQAVTNKPTATTYNYACAKCHQGNHADDTTDPRQVDVLFDESALPKNSDPGKLYSRFNGWTETGASGADGYNFMYSSGKCANLYCHGKFTGGKETNVARFDNTSGPAANWARVQRCGSCHGASVSDPPSGGAHVKHAGTYSLGCRNCHRRTNWLANYTVTDKRVHVDGRTQWMLYTAESRIGGQAKYYANYTGSVETTRTGAASYGFCSNTYCHSSGASSSQPYPAYGNHTAKWGENLVIKWPTDVGKRCSYCHGDRTQPFMGITAAMPNQANQAHATHARNTAGDNFRCSACHANVVNAAGVIVGTKHVNKFKDISIPSTYKTGAINYGAGKTCDSIKCHGGRKTPAWTSATAINCQSCHYSAGDTADYEFRNYSVSASVAKIYSSQWMDKGHGRASNYPYSNNQGAAKNCTNCHTSSVKHNVASNPFRLFTSDTDKLCAACHGSGAADLGKWSQTFGLKTSISTHSQTGTGGDAWGTAGFGQHISADQLKAKCVDCHDPHGDRSRYMVGTQLNYTGSNKYGAPVASVQLPFTTVGGNLYNWSSYVKSDNSYLCQRCHTNQASMNYFNKGTYSNHKRGSRCTDCHKHKTGFKGAGCNGCHGSAENDAPPQGPVQNNWSSDRDTDVSTQGLHRPHTYNPGGKRALNGYATNPYSCVDCHGPETDGRSETSHPTGIATQKTAGMRNMTAASTSRDKRSKFGKGSLEGFKKMGVVDDTCWNTGCHTPRAYERTWKKPADCDDCHGTIRERGAASRAYKLHTTGVHKIHINWTGTVNLPASWKKNYKFACTNCHYNVGNNFTTHYNGFVNVTASGPINTVGQDFYNKGRSFKGFTTGGDITGNTCSATYCHGSGTGTAVSWKKGVSTVNCNACHGGRDDGSDGSAMPERHPKHSASTATSYNYACSKCHLWTVSNNTTVQFNYSSHVDGIKDVKFDNVSGNFTASTRRCKNNYCHSLGDVQGWPYTMANWTADWDDATAAAKTGAGKGCSYCHGNRSYGGITAAMPTTASQAHVKHARNTAGDNFKCYVCHANTMNSAGAIVSTTNHVNKFKNISIISTYKNGAVNYGAGKTCENIRCHNGRKTPAWSGTAGCQNCHYRSSGLANEESSFTWQNYTGLQAAATADIYSSEWVQRGHGGYGAVAASCIRCHDDTVKHNVATNPFRLYTSPDSMCDDCHSTATKRGKFGAVPAMNYTGYNTHSKSQTGGNASWNFPEQRTKCVDCHDPHGDRNKKMVQTFINMSGSDDYGRPSPITATAQTNFTTYGGLYNWSSFAKTDLNYSICRRCHTPTAQDASMATMTKAVYNGAHKTHQPCTNCHGHKVGFQASGGCNACHAYPPQIGDGQAYLDAPVNEGKGAHQSHVTHLTARLGVTLAPATDIFGSPLNAGKICGICHTNNPAKHQDGSRMINVTGTYKFGPSAPFYNGSTFRSGTSMTANRPKTCSNVSCHFQTSARWQNKTAVGN